MRSANQEIFVAVELPGLRQSAERELFLSVAVEITLERLHEARDG